ncbi:DUF2804 domain-containing protein [Erysipelotrichaceae bacterium RD49]|nr:DUF2804 domain-containing protein [Erysipelotrichaceae bacterium RD49]
MNQHEIIKPTSVHQEDGTLADAGFARHPHWKYDHSHLPAARLRMKEWDYYLINTGQIAVAFTLSDLGYLRMASVSFLNLEKGLDATQTELLPPTKDFFMPTQSQNGHIRFENKNMILDYEFSLQSRKVYCEVKNLAGHGPFKADLHFTNLPEESMNILTPWPDRKHFYLNEKCNCMPAEGKVVFNYKIYRFHQDEHCGVLDWGRGYWPYKSHWYWGTASAMVDGELFGFNLGYGFGDLSAASENVLFYQGRVHKLDQIRFYIPENPMDKWMITSNDRRFEGVFTPVLDRAADIDLKVIRSDQHQYFGFVDGTAVLDDGSHILMRDLPAAFEDIHNKY